MARLQENGRYALHYLAREMSMAGFFANVLWGERIQPGAAGTDCFDHFLDTRTSFEHYNDISARGEPANSGFALPADCLGGTAYVAGSDMLLVRRTLGSPAVLQGVGVAGRDTRAIYLRVDLENYLATLEPGGGNPGPGVDIWEYAPQLLFLRNYSLNKNDGIPVLCRLRLSPGSNRLAPMQCLVEGIEDLQVEFGIDEDGDQRADRYASAPTAPELTAAVAARIWVLVRSVHAVHGYRNGHSYRLGDKLVPAAGDGHYRRVVQTTVLLRNSSVYRS